MRDFFSIRRLRRKSSEFHVLNINTVEDDVISYKDPTPGSDMKYCCLKGVTAEYRISFQSDIGRELVLIAANY